jgi:hypothetical protein
VPETVNKADVTKQIAAQYPLSVLFARISVRLAVGDGGPPIDCIRFRHCVQKLYRLFGAARCGHNVRFGSKATFQRCPGQVGLTPDNGHDIAIGKRSRSATFGHWHTYRVRGGDIACAVPDDSIARQFIEHRNSAVMPCARPAADSTAG